MTDIPQKVIGAIRLETTPRGRVNEFFFNIAMRQMFIVAIRVERTACGRILS
jgi:hypothetical protein